MKERHQQVRRWAALALGVLASALSALKAEGAVEEYRVKAAFLFHFAEFVDWPEGTFADQTSPIVYCTIGETTDMWEALQASLRGKAVRSRAVQIRRLKNWAGTEGCQVLFVGRSEEKRLATALFFLKSTPVLTVGDSEEFNHNGGIIEFCEESNKIRFHINLTAAGIARLKVSARLLALAKSVIGAAGGN